MTTRLFDSAVPELEVLYKQLAEGDLQPLWELPGAISRSPGVRAVPHRWAAKDLRELGALAGDLVPVDRGGDRRVLACSNPGLGGAPYALPTLWAAAQFLRAHEVAPAHRHSPAALRFVVEGEGVFTLVDGDPVHMAAGDLVLTPSMTFHEHHNPTDEPMIWLDVLDLPLVEALGAVFFEEGPSEEADTSVSKRSASESWFGAPGLMPAEPPPLREKGSPLLAYRWADTERALRAQLAVTGADSIRLRYTDPVRGGDVLPTMRCEIERVVAGVTTTSERQTGGRVVTVLHGRGWVQVGADRFEVGPGDILAVPTWSSWWIEAAEQIDVFSTSDAPVLEALQLFRVERGAS